MKTPVSGAPYFELTRPRGDAWRRSTLISSNAFKRPGNRAGSVKSPRSRPPWPPPDKSSRPCVRPPPAATPSASACPTSVRLSLPPVPDALARARPAAPHHRNPRQPDRPISEAEREGWLGEVEG